MFLLCSLIRVSMELNVVFQHLFTSKCCVHFSLNCALFKLVFGGINRWFPGKHVNCALASATAFNTDATIDCVVDFHNFSHTFLSFYSGALQVEYEYALLVQRIGSENAHALFPLLSWIKMWYIAAFTNVGSIYMGAGKSDILSSNLYSHIAKFWLSSLRLVACTKWTIQYGGLPSTQSCLSLNSRPLSCAQSCVNRQTGGARNESYENIWLR